MQILSSFNYIIAIHIIINHNLLLIEVKLPPVTLIIHLKIYIKNQKYFLKFHFKEEKKMLSFKFYILLLIILVNINHLLSLSNKKEKKLDANLLARQWLQQAKKDWMSMKDTQLKLKLYLDLFAKLKAKIDPDTFEQVYKIIRKEKRILNIDRGLSKMFRLKPG